MFDFMITAIDLPSYHLDMLLVNEPTAIKYVIYVCFKPFPGSLNFRLITFIPVAKLRVGPGGPSAAAHPMRSWYFLKLIIYIKR